MGAVGGLVGSVSEFKKEGGKGSSVVDLDSVIRKAVGTLGDDAEMPKAPGNATSVLKKAAEAVGSLQDTLKDVKADILKAEGQVRGLRDLAKQYAGIVGKDDLGLNPKNPDDKKKIDKARKQITDALAEVEKDAEQVLASFSAIDAILKRSG